MARAQADAQQRVEDCCPSAEEKTHDASEPSTAAKLGRGASGGSGGKDSVLLERRPSRSSSRVKEADYTKRYFSQTPGWRFKLAAGYKVCCWVLTKACCPPPLLHAVLYIAAPRYCLVCAGTAGPNPIACNGYVTGGAAISHGWRVCRCPWAGGGLAAAAAQGQPR